MTAIAGPVPGRREIHASGCDALSPSRDGILPEPRGRDASA